MLVELGRTVGGKSPIIDFVCDGDLAVLGAVTTHEVFIRLEPEHFDEARPRRSPAARARI
jgi:hypothetical protein